MCPLERISFSFIHTHTHGHTQDTDLQSGLSLYIDDVKSNKLGSHLRREKRLLTVHAVSRFLFAHPYCVLDTLALARVYLSLYPDIYMYMHTYIYIGIYTRRHLFLQLTASQSLHVRLLYARVCRGIYTQLSSTCGYIYYIYTLLARPWNYGPRD